MPSHEIPPLKPPDVDIDLNRFTGTHHHYETIKHRKFLSHSTDVIFYLLCFFFLEQILFFIVRLACCSFLFITFFTSDQHQYQTLHFNKQMTLLTKRQKPAGSIENEF